ncbi:MAG: hypothetical protein DCF15_03740 [Phormidesmis priestleyi]|uniref:Putative restriction endonuclease domain-containing protein n=1 Tax=Phormidesmis priestleyi TaxID=268141 RepID=A0A2W4XYA2_9CYAN|nr:MAG: hypothetical protein DCF15_03740 [Phormidesmis priestleyi]
MTYTPSKLLTVEDFTSQYGDDSRYELIDGELRDLEPTGPHESVAGELAGHWFSAFRSGPQAAARSWTIPKNCLICPPAAQSTALRPDVIVLDKAKLEREPFWQKEPVIASGQSIVAIAEIVSTNWQDDYARKVEEYLLLAVAEYWIVDFRGLGGLEFIGRPKQPTITICQLQGGYYQKQQFRLHEPIASRIFPTLTLTLADLMP